MKKKEVEMAEVGSQAGKKFSFPSSLIHGLCHSSINAKGPLDLDLFTHSQSRFC